MSKDKKSLVDTVKEALTGATDKTDSTLKSEEMDKTLEELVENSPEVKELKKEIALIEHNTQDFREDRLSHMWDMVAGYVPSSQKGNTLQGWRNILKWN